MVACLYCYDVNPLTDFSFLHLFLFLLSTTGFEESRQDRIVLQDIDGGALQLLIDYVYTAEVLVTEENVQVHSLAFC